MAATVLIPALNEEHRIAATVTAARAVAGVGRVLVIDDGSTDETGARARDAGAEVLSLKRNAGKGGALQAGLEHVGASADIIVLLDADLGDTAGEAAALLAPLAEGTADMTIATFPPPVRRGGFGLVKRLARWGIERLAGVRVSAPLSGQRALNRDAIAAGTPFAHGFGVEVALTVRVARAGLRVREVRTDMRHAETGRDLPGFVHRGRQLLAVAWTLARLSFERQSADASAG